MLKDDGLVQTKAAGRSDYYERWPSIKKAFLDDFKSRKERTGIALNVELKPTDEWCAEAYVETDYSQLTREDFERTLKRYFLFKRKMERADLDELAAQVAEELLNEAA